MQPDKWGGYGRCAEPCGKQPEVSVQRFLRIFQQGYDGTAGKGRAAAENGAGKPGISGVG